MNTIPTSERTLADFLKDLGDIPPYRIRMHPVPGTATERDVIRILDRENRLFELVDGVLVEKAMGWAESAIGGELFRCVANFVKEHDLGVTIPADGPVRLWKGLVRMPDVAVFGWHHFPNRAVSYKAIAELYPDLAVEVLSRGNTKKEIDRKLREYFLAGTRLAWVIDPKKRIARVYLKPDDFTLLGESDRLDGGEVLAGFSVRLNELFAVVGEPEPARKRSSRKRRE